MQHSEPLATKALKELSPDQQRKLASMKTSHGVDLRKILQSDIENPDSSIGCYAGDAQSYTIFAPFFDRVIKEYHNVDLQKDCVQDTNFNGIHAFSKKISDLIVSTRVRVARSLSNYPFESSMTTQQRLDLEKYALSAIDLVCKGTEFEGTYYTLAGLSNAQKEQLLKEHLLFKEGDRFLRSAGITAGWPIGRGVYASANRHFAVWINEEDHLRIMYFDRGSDVASIATKLFAVVNELGHRLPFAFNKKLGYLNSCPTNIGTAMRVSILIKMPYYTEAELKKLCSEYGLSVRGTFGEHTEARDGVYDVSLKKRLGNSERGLITEFIADVNALAAE